MSKEYGLNHLHKYPNWKALSKDIFPWFIDDFFRRLVIFKTFQTIPNSLEMLKHWRKVNLFAWKVFIVAKIHVVPADSKVQNFMNGKIEYGMIPLPARAR